MEEIEAGVSRFDKFGEFNLIYGLAGGDVTKFDAVFNITYSEAFLTLYRRAEEAKYSKALRKLMNNRK